MVEQQPHGKESSNVKQKVIERNLLSLGGTFRSSNDVDAFSSADSSLNFSTVVGSRNHNICKEQSPYNEVRRKHL